MDSVGYRRCFLHCFNSPRDAVEPARTEGGPFDDLHWLHELRSEARDWVTLLPTNMQWNCHRPLIHTGQVECCQSSFEYLLDVDSPLRG